MNQQIAEGFTFPPEGFEPCCCQCGSSAADHYATVADIIQKLDDDEGS